jgi:hypothetical protein
MKVKYPDVTVTLSSGADGNADGNAYGIIAAVRRGISRVHGPEAASAYEQEARLSTSYDALIQHAMRTVNVE